MLPAVSLSSVHHLHRSLVWCVSHLSISSSPGALSGLPLVARDGGYVGCGLQSWKTVLLAWAGLGATRRVSKCVGTSFRMMAAMGESNCGERLHRQEDLKEHEVALSKKARLNAEAAPHSRNGWVKYEFAPSSRGWVSPVDHGKHIFCNRSLNMKSIVAVGFDMDYTLAQYKAETFETLAYMGTIKKLVHDLGYSEELLDWKFDCKYMVRGLVLDKKRGNILKMDRHKYVKVAYHGFKEMSREDRMSTYGNTLSRESFDEPDYALIDTLFSLAEAYLFAQLVDLREQFPEKVPRGSSFSEMYRDVRAAVDLCHRDGTLKQAVAHNPGKYIYEDKQLISMLKMLRDSGRMTFIVTNSFWDYTHVVMNYLFGKSGTDGGLPRDDEWLNYFDVVITGSAKPVFFLDGNRAPLFEVDLKTGMLQNTDNGSPLAQVGADVEKVSRTKIDQGCRVFQGGSVTHLHRLLAIEASAQVLYVGDHIYGDILRSKKALGWRTMLVVPELENELQILNLTADIHKEVQNLRQQLDGLEDTLQRLEWDLKSEEYSEAKQARAADMELVQSQRDHLRRLHRQHQRDCHHKFHNIWGQLMKTGYQNSRFAHQVERFACLYTSHVSNLIYYSPDKSYRTTEDYMPHEMDILCS